MVAFDEDESDKARSRNNWRSDLDDWEDEEEYVDDDSILRTTQDIDKRVDRMDRAIDLFMRKMATEKRSELKEKSKQLATDTRITIKTWDELGDEYSEKIIYTNPFNAVMDFIIRHPVWISTGVILFCLLFGVFGVIGNPLDPEWDSTEPRLRKQMRGDFEVYLPQGDDTKKVLDEIKEDWTSDLAILYVQTENRFDETDNRSVLDREVVVDISRIEDTLNPDRTDRGKNDDIVFIFSIATVIKTINATPEQVKDAISIETNIDLNVGGLETNYAIPNQAEYDEMLSNLPVEAMSTLVQDTNNDSVYDTTIVLIGLEPFADKDEILQRILTPGRKVNDDPKTPGLIDDFYVDPNPDTGAFSFIQEESYYTEDGWRERYDNEVVHCRITLTGPTPLTKAITDRMYAELTWVTPVALAGVLGSLFFFHRTLKIILVSLIPIVCTILLTFSILVVLTESIDTLVLTPQVTMVAPMIIALGVAYGLYIANRYSEEQSIEDKNERIRFSVQTTGTAVFLSALTTAIGFASLMLVDMIPVIMLGMGLSLGIMVAWLMTMLLVPSLVLATNYKKKSKSTDVSKSLGDIPVNNRKKILVSAAIFTVISIICLMNVEANMDVMKMAPDDESVVLSMRAYSAEFGGGQMGLFYIEGDGVEWQVDSEGKRTGRTEFVTDSMRDFEVLKKFSNLEDNIANDNRTYAQPLCIVDVMKMIKVPDFTENDFWLSFLDQIPEIYRDDINQFMKDNVIGKSFFEAAQNAPNNEDIITTLTIGESYQQFLVNVFYNSLPDELRGMLVNDEYSRAIMYVDMPNMDIQRTGAAVDAVNGHIEDKPLLFGSKITGFGAVLVVINEMLLQMALISTVIALGFVLAVLWLIFKSVKIAIFTLIPVILVVIWQYALLFGLLGVGIGMQMALGLDEPYFSGTLNLFTATIGSIITGVGIDFGIHITQRVREKGMNKEAVHYAVSTSGMSFIESTTTMIFGFLPMMLIPIPIIKEFILIVVFLMIFSAWGAIMVLPSIYTIYFDIAERRRLFKEQQEKEAQQG